MSKLLALAVLLVALLPLDARAQAMPYGTVATRWHHVTVLPDGSAVDRPGWVYSSPVKPATHRAKPHHKYVIRRNAPHSRHIRRHEPIKKLPAGYWASYWITGYSHCETHGDQGADSTPVYWGMAAATDPGYYGGLVYGTRVLVPSLGRVVTIHDRGAFRYFDMGTPHIDVYFYWDCSDAQRTNRTERVFIYS